MSVVIGVEWKDPDDIVLRTIDWEDHLAAGDTIDTSTWIPPSGMTIVEDLSFSGFLCSARIGGGTSGETYQVTNRIVTDLGEQLDRAIEFHVR